MELEAITLMEAYIIKNLRQAGVSNEELIAINDEAMAEWKVVNDRYDYDVLDTLAKENCDSFTSVIENGYRVKFLTLNGLINLIELKLGKKKAIDFTLHDDGISALDVTEAEQAVIEQFISSNWQMTLTETGLSVRARV